MELARHRYLSHINLMHYRTMLAAILFDLDGTLIPDSAVNSDVPTPSGKKTPLAMRDYDYVVVH